MNAGIHELTAGYALDALDAREREAFEAHLPGCERCQEELAGFWEVTGALAIAASGAEPSAGLRERILASVEADRRREAEEGTSNVIPLEARRRRRLVPLLAAASAAAAALALGAGLYAVALHGRLGDTRAALAQERVAAAVLADPSARTVALARGRGRLVVAPAGSAALVLDDLAPAPPGKTYQVWVVRGSRPRAAGLFQAGGREVVGVSGDVKPGDVVAVTLERAGGAAAPTSPPLAASQPA